MKNNKSDETIRILNKIKNLQNDLGLDPNLSSRLYFWSLIEKLSQRSKSEIDLPEMEIRKFINMVNIDEIETQKILSDPDIIDSLFEEYIPKESRKTHGQFLTPKLIAQFMAKWGLTYQPKRILDPSVGPGIFLSEIMNEKNGFERVVGLDIDNLMLNIAKTRLIGIRKHEKIELINGDFLTYNPEGTKFDFIICNPPYLKFHSYNRNKSISIESEANVKISKLTNIYTLFFLHGDFLLGNGGCMAFITPSDFLITGYGIQLKEFLLGKYTIESILLVDSKCLVFNGVDSSAAITLLRKEKPNKNHKVKLIKIQKWDDNEKIFDALYNSKSSTCISIVEKLQSKLIASEKWLTYFESDKEENVSGLVPLNKIADVKRGIATGHNDFFSLSIDEINKFGIPKEYLKPVISKARQFHGYKFSKSDFNALKNNQEKMFLLYYVGQSKEPIKKYVEYGESIGVNERYLTKHRDPWYLTERREAAPILATVFSRERMRFVSNEAKVLYLTAFHGIYPNFDDENKIKALLSYLNSNVCSRIIEREKRTYGGGLDHFQPGDLDNILVLDIESMERSDVTYLASCFDILSESKNITEENQIKEKIDAFITTLLEKSTPRDIVTTVQSTL